MNGKYHELAGNLVLHEFATVLKSDSYADDVTIMEGYLAHKWSIQSELPENHTYKNNKP